MSSAVWGCRVSQTVQDIFAGGSRGADEVIDTLPDGKNAVTDTVGKGLKATGKAVSDGAESH